MPQFMLTSPDPAATPESLVLAVTGHSSIKPFFYEAARVHVTAEKDAVADFCRTNPGWTSFEYTEVNLDPSDIRPQLARKTFLQRLGFKS